MRWLRSDGGFALCHRGLGRLDLGVFMGPALSSDAWSTTLSSAGWKSGVVWMHPWSTGSSRCRPPGSGIPSHWRLLSLNASARGTCFIKRFFWGGGRRKHADLELHTHTSCRPTVADAQLDRAPRKLPPAFCSSQRGRCEQHVAFKSAAAAEASGKIACDSSPFL